MLALLCVACSDNPSAIPRADAGPPASTSDGGRSDGGATLAAFRHDALFVGNSYIYVNDVSGHYRAITSALPGAVRVEEVTTGGYTLAQHAADANTPGKPLARWLRTGTHEETAFDAVILQEQSQTGGFPESTPQRRNSVGGATELARLARAQGAAVVLYHTWGGKRGDPANAAIFGTYLDMQTHLDSGYLGLAEHLSALGYLVRVAPVGGGFRIVYEDVIKVGADPLAAASDFDALYEADGSHPSLRGAYLAACILAGTTTFADVRTFIDEPTLGAVVSARLRDVCARALADPRWRLATVQVSESVLKPADGRNGTAFGQAIALRSDGAEILVHASFNSSETPALRAFSREISGWSAASISVGGGGEDFVIASSGDGERFIVGHYDEHGNTPGGYAGAARVYLRGSLIEEPLPRTVFQASQRFGAAVALDGDGTRAIIGAPGENQSAGSARIYVRRFDGWEEEARLTPTGPTTGRYYGVAVAISDDGARALVGSPARTAGVPSQVLVFARTANGWAQEAVLASPIQDGSDWFGGALALSADGNHALVGASQAGISVPFVRGAAGWTRESTLRPVRELYTTFSLDEMPNGSFGTTVALSANGSRALVSAAVEDRPAGRGAGSVFSFVRNDTGYQQDRLLLPRLGVYGARFGASVALSADGTTAVVAAPSERLFPDQDLPLATGAVHVFDLR